MSDKKKRKRVLHIVQDTINGQKLTPMLARARERHILGWCTYYFAEFTGDSTSDFRFGEIHSVSAIQLGMQDTVV